MQLSKSPRPRPPSNGFVDFFRRRLVDQVPGSQRLLFLLCLFGLTRIAQAETGTLDSGRGKAEEWVQVFASETRQKVMGLLSLYSQPVTISVCFVGNDELRSQVQDLSKSFVDLVNESVEQNVIAGQKIALVFGACDGNVLEIEIPSGLGNSLADWTRDLVVDLQSNYGRKR